MGVWFGILGPLEARVDGAAIELPAKARLVLATLLCQPGRVVSDDRLQAAAWRDAPPRSATQNLRTYVHLLRRAFGEDRIARGANGYLLHVLDGELDVLEFERLAARASGAPAAEAARLLSAADLTVSALDGGQVTALLAACADPGGPPQPAGRAALL